MMCRMKQARGPGRRRCGRSSVLLVAVVALVVVSGASAYAATSLRENDVNRVTSAPFFSGVGVGSMTTVRQSAVAAPLPDGRVLIAGGFYEAPRVIWGEA
jgi:hypothetical protein